MVFSRCPAGRQKCELIFTFILYRGRACFCISLLTLPHTCLDSNCRSTNEQGQNTALSMHSIRFRNLKFTETLLIQNVVTAVEENLAVISHFVFNIVFHIKRKIPHILSLCCNSVFVQYLHLLFEAKLYHKTSIFFLQNSEI